MERYWNEQHFNALEVIKTAADKAGLTMTEVALRWVSHHSLMKHEHGDKIIIGASSVKHIKEVRKFQLKTHITLIYSCLEPGGPREGTFA